MRVLVLILELTRRFLKLGRNFTGSVAEKTSKVGARNVRPVPFERIALDIASLFPMTENGNEYIMVVRDYFSKWPEPRSHDGCKNAD